jgi:hypothetical protein
MTRSHSDERPGRQDDREGAAVDNPAAGCNTPDTNVSLKSKTL